MNATQAHYETITLGPVVASCGPQATYGSTPFSKRSVRIFSSSTIY
jgi:hypothetical protein